MDKQVISSSILRRCVPVSAGILFVVVAVFCLYLPTLGNGFVNYDDPGYILDNPAIRVLDFNLLRWSFWGFHEQFYIPFTWLSLALDYHFWGLDPKGYHLTNNVLHAINAGLVTLLCREFLESLWVRQKNELMPDELRQPWILMACLAAGLAFGFHPLRVESVAWATERKDVLSAFFALSSLIAYVRYARERAESVNSSCWLWYLASIVLFLFSLLSKPMMVTMPAVLLLLDWYPLGRLTGKREILEVIKEKVPFIGLALCSLVIVLFSQLDGGVSFAEVSILSRLLLACKSIICYVFMMVWPSGLVPLYPHPGNEAALDKLEYVLSVVAVCSISVIAWRLAIKGNRKWLWVWCCFLITLLPVIGITQVGLQAMADRFTYIPAVFPTIVAMMLFLRIPSYCEAAGFKHSVAVSLVVFLFVLIVSAYTTISRNLMAVWFDSGTMWSRVIDIKPMEFAQAYHSRGYFYAERGEFEKALEDMNKSISVVKSKYPQKLPNAYMGRGVILMRMNRFQEAYDDFSKVKAIAQEPMPELEFYLSTVRNVLESERLQKNLLKTAPIR